jgi:hypothetical protein
MQKGQYIILKLTDKGVDEYMKDSEGSIMYYSTLESAEEACWIYELDDAWIVKLVQRYQETP